MKYTQREFYLLMQAHEEKRLDELEFEAVKALMIRKAYHSDKKNMAVTDFFDRTQVDGKSREEVLREKIEQAKEDQSWLNQIDFSSLKGGK